jgi:hypothetical protein
VERARARATRPRNAGQPLTFGTSKSPSAVTWLWWTVHLGSAHARWGCDVTFSFDEVLVEVYKQLFSDNARVVKIGTPRYPIQRSHGGHLRQVNFLFDGHDLRGIEQNPGANNRWAALVRSGKKLRSFLAMVVTSQA